jgi:hypothetical protein
MWEDHDYGRPNAIVSLNWDLLAEKALTGSGIAWRYGNQAPFVPIIKPHGSINWSKHLKEGQAESPDWCPIAPSSPFAMCRTIRFLIHSVRE